MKCEIKHRFSGEILFALEAESMRLCVEAAVKAGADLAGAYLARAYLAGANGRRLTLIGNRPILHIGPLGSRSDTLQAAITDHGVYVRTGCFGWRPLADFRAAVTETHGDGIHAQEYAAAITLIETHARLWTPAKESV